MQGVRNPNPRLILICACLLFAIFSAHATHTRSGELTYTSDPADPLIIHVRLITYTDFSITEPDNFFVTISFGDGSTQELERRRRSVIIKNSIYKNIYETTHAYPSPGIYQLTHREQNRQVGINNMLYSEDQAFAITTQVNPDQFLTNNSARFLTAPLLEVPLGANITHQLGAYDPDGDSLTFELVPPLQASEQNTSGYFLPEFIKINNQTGEFTWDRPQVAGFYSFAAKISEYRNNKLIGYVLRDFTVLVRDFTSNFNQSLLISNRDEAGITVQNQILLAPNQTVKINGLLSDNEADSTRLEIYSDLLEKGNDLVFTQTKTGNTATAELNFVAEPALKRNAPYLVILRGHSYKGTEMYNQEISIQVFVKSETTTGAGNPVETKAFLIYPNPAEEFIVIQHPKLKKNTQLFVYDDTGRLIWSQKLTKNATTIWRSQLAKTGKFIYTIAEDQQITNTGQFIFR